METVDLPKGWFKEEVVRKSGLSAGKTDIYYYGYLQSITMIMLYIIYSILL